MNPEAGQCPRKGFCIFINTFCQGPVPSVSDENGHLIFDTEREAQLEIADFMMTRLREFIDGERDFADAIATEECVVPVTVHPDGTFTDDCGRTFPLRADGQGEGSSLAKAEHE